MQPRPAINGMSIGYRVKEFAMGTKPGEPRRTLKKVDVHEISLVTFPANRSARVSQVKAIEDIATLSDAEAWLRDAAGVPRSAALAFVSRVKGLRPSDSEGLDELAAWLANHPINRK
jgi:hypothetical protein